MDRGKVVQLLSSGTAWIGCAAADRMFAIVSTNDPVDAGRRRNKQLATFTASLWFGARGGEGRQMKAQ